MTSLPRVAPSPASLVSNALAALPGKMLDLITSPWPKSISNQYKRGNPPVEWMAAWTKKLLKWLRADKRKLPEAVRICE